MGETMRPPQSTAVEGAPSMRMSDSADRPPFRPKVLDIWSCELEREVMPCDSVVPARANTKFKGCRVLLGRDCNRVISRVVELLALAVSSSTAPPAETTT